jgi:acyl carrier protein
MPENEEFIDVDKQIEMEIKDIIEDLLKCSLDVDESLEFDSIIVVNLLVVLEQKYNISIPLEYVDIKSFNSIQSISKFVENYLLN